VAEYTKSEARDWARVHLRGVNGVCIPTYTNDLQKLNEKAIRYDIRKDVEYGMAGSLIVSETATTEDEFIQFTEWAADEAKGRLNIIHHASWNTLDQAIKMTNRAEQAGADLVLLSYPPSFYPKTDDDIFEYTKKFGEGTNLGFILFPVPLWSFEHVHPMGMSPQLMQRMVKEIPNLVAIKAEHDLPHIAGFIWTWNHFKDDVVITCPIARDAIPLKTVVPIQAWATSNYQFFGPIVPRIFNLLEQGDTEQAWELYWKLQPAFNYNGGTPGANFVHRMEWKYQGWLSGYNGGPLRQPTMRLNDGQMRGMRRSLIASGLEVTPEEDDQFFVGRNPA
jgi:4-hydroxy-tetrahydrodipicolinate synthase